MRIRLCPVKNQQKNDTRTSSTYSLLSEKALTMEDAHFHSVAVQINRYLSLLLLFFGIVGNLLNCLVFSQRKLRSSPCVTYFLVASIANLISIVSGLPPRMLRDWNITADLTETTPVLCKIRLWVLFTTRNIASWLLVCAALDRYLVSSTKVTLRQLSNRSRAGRWITAVCVGSVLFWSECIYCFDANRVNTPLKCYAKSRFCRILNDISQALLTTIIPSSIMLMLGLNTIANIQRAQIVIPVAIGKNNSLVLRTRKTDHSLTRMLLVQIILLTMFNIPQAIQKFYLTITFYQAKTSAQRNLEKFLFAIVMLLTYIPNCLTFYLYTFSGSLFRRTLFQLFREWIRRSFFCRHTLY